MTTPDKLIPALRQYKHNDNSEGFVAAFDYDDTVQIVTELEQQLAELTSALEVFADDQAWMLGGVCDPNSSMFCGQKLAQQALQGGVEKYRQGEDRLKYCTDNTGVAPTAKEFGGSEMEAMLNQREDES